MGFSVDDLARCVGEAPEPALKDLTDLDTKGRLIMDRFEGQLAVHRRCLGPLSRRGSRPRAPSYSTGSAGSILPWIVRKTHQLDPRPRPAGSQSHPFVRVRIPARQLEVGHRNRGGVMVAAQRAASHGVRFLLTTN